MKLSLCVIAGNVEGIMPRFLEQFQPLADEVIVLSAIGNLDPDWSLANAKKAGCRTDVYLNKHIEDRAHWPHVDDFAAARNQACDMATGDWLIWADTDDTITADSIAQIKRLIEDIGDSDIDGVLMRYVVPEDGVVNWRERLWRRGSARWVHPIHECLEFKEGAKHIRFDGAEIVHASEKRSASRDQRNLRILESIPENERTISQKFHVFQSMIALDRNADAIPKAIEFIGLEGVGKNERYEAFFQLARLADDDATKRDMLLQALAVDPTRPEAYGELALANIPIDPQASLGWSAAMMALPMPQEPPWNLRRAYFGQLGIGLRGMALRANGRHEEATAMETNHFIRNGAKISLLHATRGRPAQAWRCRMKWMRSADNPDAIEHIFGLDTDDHASLPLANVRHVVGHPTPGHGPVGAWNACAAASKGQILVQLSDDWEPVQGWDTAILSAIGDTSKPAVLAVSDGHRKDDLLCMAILTRARYKQQGYLFHPEFFSMHSDNWFSECAFRDGVVIDARDRITFEHLHPVHGKGEWDETYARSNASENYQRGQKTFDRLKSGIALAREIPGWCDYSAFYRALAQSLPDGGEFVEIGSWMGQSISFFCQELQDTNKSVRVWCVDTFKGEQNQPSHLAMVEENGGSIREVFERNTKATGVRDMIEVIEGDSAESAASFADDSLDAVYIDAAHDYDSVVKDLAAWFPKVKADGIFSGHDYPHWEVKQAVDEHAAANGYTVEQIGRVWMRSKIKP
jgi:hypothetical protein